LSPLEVPTFPLAPNAVIGILGGGQLAQMLSMAATELGFLTAFIDPDPHAPAQKVSNHIQAAFNNPETLLLLSQAAQVVTLEFENVPDQVLEQLEHSVLVYPAKEIFKISRNRVLEKKALVVAGLQVAPYWAILGEPQLEGALAGVGGKGILKTAELGYDGKGQKRVSSEAELRAAWLELGEVPCVLEGIVPFVRELSVQVARNPQGEMAVSGVVHNTHVGGILRRSVFGNQLEDVTRDLAQNMAQNMARTLAEKWNVVGLLTLELFELADGTLLVNEIAPRVHNSGHLTQNGGGISQFEAQIRAVTGLPLRDFAPALPCMMVNILGWQEGQEPDWSAILRIPGTHLHLYGKQNRPGRKLGHVNIVAGSSATPNLSQNLSQNLQQMLERGAAVERLLFGEVAP
jgi:5-(carboxyamino)imidazole ribonucleotide synthase